MPICPILDRECIKGACQWHTRVIGNNPQTGVHMDVSDCAVTLLPVLLVEVAKQAVSTTASIDKLATEISNAENELTRLLKAKMQARLSSEQNLMDSEYGNSP